MGQSFVWFIDYSITQATYLLIAESGLSFEPVMYPITGLSVFGLAFNRVCRAIAPLGLCGGLLPRRFTLTHIKWAVCFLRHYPSGHPARTLSGIVSFKSPDFPPTFQSAIVRLSDGIDYT